MDVDREWYKGSTISFFEKNLPPTSTFHPPKMAEDKLQK
jgi:hypothetical protein